VWTMWIKLLKSINLRSVEHRVPIRRRIQVYSMIFAMYLQRQTKRKYAGTKKVDLALTLKAGGAKHAVATASLKSKCTFFQTYTFLVKYVKEKDTIEKR